MVHQAYIQELQVTEQNIQQARGHIGHERAVIQELRENGGNSQAAEALLHALDRVGSGSGVSH
jgi:hypothetical protein